MVTLKPLFSGDGFSAELFADIPSALPFRDKRNVSVVVGALTQKDVAIVISLSSQDALCVYIIGPNGSGWTFGAYLTSIVSVTRQ